MNAQQNMKYFIEQLVILQCFLETKLVTDRLILFFYKQFPNDISHASYEKCPLSLKGGFLFSHIVNH